MTSGKEATMMARPLTLRIAVADGEHARFVQPDARQRAANGRFA